MPDMEYSLSELWRRVQQMIRRGVIHSVQASPPRCRVTLGTDTVTGEAHVTDWLQWYANSDGERSDWNMPAVGAPATIISESGDLKNGTVFPGMITDNQTPAGSTPGAHVTRYSDGASFSYDTSTHGAVVSLPGGGTVKIIGAGGITLDGPVTVTKTLTVQETAEVMGNISSGGDIEAAGNISDQGDAASSMAKIREIFDEHDHNENGDGGGVTDPPNQKL